MSLFDRITQSLDRLLSTPQTVTPEDEQGHIDLLAQSSGRIRDTLEAIKQGNLVAASSSTEDLRAMDEMRYQELVGGSKRNQASFVDRLANETSEQSRAR